MRLVVIVQARMSSKNLPGKVMLPIGDEPLLAAMLRRLRLARTQFELVVATTTDQEDAVLVNLCEKLGIMCFRGHPSDLLHRHYHAAIARRADTVVKIPSDCPLIDPAIVDRVLQCYLRNRERFAFVSNLHPATYPEGNDVEVMSMQALDAAYHEATQPFERERTTPFIWKQPGRFRIGNVEWETGSDYSMTHRFKLEHDDDYQFIRRVFEELGGPRSLFTLYDVLELLAHHPEIRVLNARLSGANGYDNCFDEFRPGPSQHMNYLEPF